MLRIETRARARAVQLLYAWDQRGRPPLPEVLASVSGLLPLPPRVAEPALTLASHAIARCEASDRLIAQTAVGWRLERVGQVERAILRLALAELDGVGPPVRVVIDEAVKLAHWFAGPKAPSFINGVLDAAARTAGHL